MDLRQIAAAAAAIMFAAPSTAGTLQFWEDTRGAPGLTAQFPTGTLLYADIDYDADTAEGGGLFYGANDIEIRPTGTVWFVDFTCHIPGCSDSHYVFTPGDASEGGKIVVSDARLSEQHGIQDLGAITFDAEEEPGRIDLIRCNYFALDFQEHTCNRFTLVALPEPSALAMLCAGAALLAALAGAGGAYCGIRTKASPERSARKHPRSIWRCATYSPIEQPRLARKSLRLGFSDP